MKEVNSLPYFNQPSDYQDEGRQNNYVKNKLFPTPFIFRYEPIII